MADDWEVSFTYPAAANGQNDTEPISQPPQGSQPPAPKPRILARPQPSTQATSDPNPRYDSAFPALGAEGKSDGDDDWFRGPQQNNRQLWDTA